jgi:hypothetical protein
MTDIEKYWSEHLRVIDRTGSTTKAYADLHGLSVKELYEWRRKLKARDQAQHEHMSAVSGPTEESADKSSTSKLTASKPSTASNPFVPVQVRPPVAAAPTSCVVQCGAIRIELDTLPSVQWIASLNQAIGRAS